MKTRRLLLTVLLLILLFCLAAPGASAASADCCEVAIGGTENYTEAFDVLTLVNELRESLGVQTLTMDATLMDYAMHRAAELAVCYSHTRPDGSSFNSGCSKASGENIAIGANSLSTAEEAYTSWYNSPGHYENMVRESFSSIGVGSFTVGNFHYWVQVFSRSDSSGVSADAYPDNLEVIVSTNVLNSHIKDTITPVPPDTASLMLAGDTADFRLFSLDSAIRLDFYYDLVELPSNSVIYRSSDPAVCTVSEYGSITATGPGSATLTVWYPGLENDPWSFDITVCAGHEYDGGVVTKEPTCGERGTVTYTCTRCGNTTESTIPATGEHTYDDGAVTEEATCKDWGFLQYSCTVCNGGGYIETIAPLGHDWDDGVITTRPTCAQQGWITYTCSRCSATTMEDIGFSSEHTWDEGTVVRQPNLSQSGEIRYDCTLCSATKTEPLELPAGDVDGSNQADAKDVVVLMKHVLGDSTPVNEKALDVNGDDRTDILDIIRLIRWLADKSIELN